MSPSLIPAHPFIRIHPHLLWPATRRPLSVVRGETRAGVGPLSALPSPLPVQVIIVALYRLECPIFGSQDLLEYSAMYNPHAYTYKHIFSLPLPSCPSISRSQCLRLDGLPCQPRPSLYSLSLIEAGFLTIELASSRDSCHLGRSPRHRSQSYLEQSFLQRKPGCLGSANTYRACPIPELHHPTLPSPHNPSAWISHFPSNR
ncbi:hypothetical protein LY78DRAFT_324667 [Colletotrichum sublineola]|nr:hypothetical protein LY78DRAFT_324667 [Colletotrichum sublineola]